MVEQAMASNRVLRSAGAPRMRLLLLLFTSALLAGGLVVWPLATSASAASPRFYASPSGTGTACSSSTPCTLSEALSLAGSDSGAVTIYLVAGPGADCPASSHCQFDGDLTVGSGSESGLTIEGTGTGSGSSAASVLDGENSVENVGTTLTDNAGFAVTLDNLTVTGGYAGFYGGGGIYDNGGTMTVEDSTINDNSATDYGGGINNNGTMAVIDSTISNNSVEFGSSDGGGGVYDQGGDMTIVDSTISNNGAPTAYGGGVYDQGGDMTIVDSTISSNSAMFGGGGIYNSAGAISVAGSIVANSLSGGDCYLNTIQDLGYNLSSGTSCHFGTGDDGAGVGSLSSVTNLDLGDLAANGGPTETVDIPAGSPGAGAIGSLEVPIGGSPVDLCSDPSFPTVPGQSVSLRTDQRGVTRPGTDCSAGAYQLPPVIPPPPPPAPVVSSLLASSGPASGGTSVTITGKNLLGAAFVDFGTEEASSFEVVSPSEITAVSPPGSAATSVELTVITPGGTSDGLPFSYQATSTPPPASSEPAYHAIIPTRICDTRPGNPSGLSGAARTNCEGRAPGPGGVLTIQVAGLAGIPAGATEVALDVVAADPSASGYLSVYPAGTTRPGTSSLNFSAGATRANLVMVALPTSGASTGEVSVYNYAGTTNVVIDAEGYVATETTSGAGLYVPLTPSRICDTRPSNPSGLAGPALSNCEGKAPAAGGSLSVQVAGLGGVPGGATAAVVSIGAIDPLTSGYLVAYPAGTSAPEASDLYYAPGSEVTNSAIVPLGTGGAIQILSSGGAPNITVDLEGYITSASTALPANASSFVAAGMPTRICDTRPSNPSGLAGQELANCEGKAPGAGGSLPVQVTGLAGVPADATAAVVNITVTGTSATSYLSAAAYQPSADQAAPTTPPSALLVWNAGETLADLAIVPIGAGGQIYLTNHLGQAQVILDVVGWLVPVAG